METRENLVEEIRTVHSELANTKVGSEEYENISKDLARLYGILAEMDKISNEKDSKEKSLKIDICDKTAKNILTALGTVTGIMGLVWGTNKVLSFDENGHVVTSTIGKNYISKITQLLPKL